MEAPTYDELAAMDQQRRLNLLKGRIAVTLKGRRLKIINLEMMPRARTYALSCVEVLENGRDGEAVNVYPGGIGGIEP